MDGGFVKKKLQQKHKRVPTVQDIAGLSQKIMQNAALLEKDLLRVYFYDAPPFEGKLINPIDRTRTDFAVTSQARLNHNLLRDLELQPNFAVRRGLLKASGWKIGNLALKSISRTPRSLNANDFVPNFMQKGVDMRIGLDVAWLSLKGIVESIVLVTGDSDLVPAMKASRREGVVVYLETLGHPVFRELKAHADRVL